MNQVLADMDDERLVGLLAARPDLAQPEPASFAELAVRASAWPSVHACFRALDRTHRQIIEALCLLDHPTGVRQLAGLLDQHLDPAELDVPLRRLEDLGLVCIDDVETVWLVGALWQLRFPAGLGPPAATLFQSFPHDYLADIARHLGVSRGRTKADTLQALADGLRDATTVAAAVAAGPPGTAELAARLAAGPPVTSVGGSWYQARDHTPHGWLVNRGLIAVPEWGEAVMPGEAALALRDYRLFPGFSLGRPAVTTVECDSEVVDATAAHAGLRLIADLSTMLLDWEVSPPKLLKSGGMGVRDVRRVAAAIERDTDDTARIIELAAAAGLIGLDHARPEGPETVLPTPAFDGWLSAGPGERWAAVVGAWLDCGHHLGVALGSGMGSGVARPLAGRIGGSARAQRHAMLAVLAELPAGRGATADGSPGATLATAVTWAEPVVWDSSPPFAVGSLVAEAELLGLVASGSLSTTGRLAVAGQLDQAARALAARSPSVVSDFVVQADLTAVAAGILTPAVRAELDLLADVESTGAATVYRFSPSSLVRAFDAGRTSEQIGAWLDRHSRSPVPQALSYLVGDLGRRYGQLRVGPAHSYLRCDDPSLVAEVLQARATARLALRQLAPGVLVSPADPAKVTAALRAAGYLAADEAADGTLVIRRPDRPRAPAGRQPTSAWQPAAARTAESAAAGDAAADLTAIVAALRKAPMHGAPAWTPFFDTFDAIDAPGPPYDDEFDDSDDLAWEGRGGSTQRPSALVKDPVAIRVLLHLAGDEEWLVRAEYTDDDGQRRQLNMAPLEFDDESVLVALPDHSPVQVERLACDRIQWARVLTAAEEHLIQ